MFIVGVTGGIGSGKSTVTDIFEELDVTVVDADIIAREVLEKKPAALKKIASYFGESVLKQDGALDRKALGKLVFGDEKKRRWLELLLHPLIAAEAQRQIGLSTSFYTIYSAALLIETILQNRSSDQNTMHAVKPHRILVVDVPVETQIARASSRDGDTEEKVRAVIDAQIDRDQRRKFANDIVDNSGDLESLEEQCRKLHFKYLVLSAESY